VVVKQEKNLFHFGQHWEENSLATFQELPQVYSESPASRGIIRDQGKFSSLSWGILPAKVTEISWGGEMT
jgi:hypothetical protein